MKNNLEKNSIKRVQKSKNKEQGSITIFIVISIIFFLIIAIGVYISISNKSSSQNSEISKIKSEYEISKEQIDEKYEEIIKDYNDQVKITAKKVTDNSEYISGTLTNDSVKVTIEFPETVADDEKIIYINGKETIYKEELIIEETSTIKVIYNGKEQTLQINIDKILPKVTITADTNTPTNASSIMYTFTFSEEVTGFTQDSISVTNGVKGKFAGSKKEYTLIVTNTGSTTQKIQVEANKCKDYAGNGNIASNIISINIDREVPTVTIVADKTSPTNSSTINYTINFSEEVTGFTKDSITVTNGTKGAFSGSGKTYTLAVTQNSTATQQVKIEANKCKDKAGNANTASNTISILIDKTPPSIFSNMALEDKALVSIYGEDNESGIAYIEDSKGNKHTPKSKNDVKILVIENQKENNMQTNQGIMPYLLEQYKNVEGNASKTYDQIIQGGYDVIISYKTAWSTAQADLLNKLFAAGKSIITVGNDNTNAINIIKSNTSSSVGYTANRKVTNEVTNKMSGTLTAGDDGMQNVQANDKAEVWYSFTSGNVEYDAIMYMENAKGGKWFHSQMALSGSALRGALNVITRLSNINGVSEQISAQGTYTYKVVDKAGNVSTKQVNVPKLDTTAPTVKVTANKSSPTNASSITYTFTFSENVTGFTKEDVQVTNGSKGTFSGSGKTYTLVVTNSGSTTQSVKVNANACTDGAGNGNTASNTVSITIDRTAPTVKVTANKSSPTNASSITYTFTFSENVTGFTKDDVQVTNGAKGTFSGSGKTYTLVVTNSGSVSQKVQVGAGVCQDSVGNKNTASNALTITVDRAGPTCTITTNVGSVANARGVTYTIKFSENVTGFAKNDLTLTHVGDKYYYRITSELGALNSNITLKGADAVPIVQSNTMKLHPGVRYKVEFKYRCTSGTNKFNVDFYPDTLPQKTFTATTTEQSAVWNATSTNGNLASCKLRFFDDIQESNESDIIISNIILHACYDCSITSFSGSGSTYTAVAQMNCTDAYGAAQISLQVAAGKCTDAAGNANKASNTVTNFLDRIAPNVPNISTSTSGSSITASVSNIADTGSGVKNVKYYLDGTLKSTSSSANSSQSYTFTGVSAGSHTIKVEVIDKAGLVSSRSVSAQASRPWNDGHTHTFGNSPSKTIQSGAYFVNYRIAPYHFSGSWVCTSNHSHGASTTYNAYHRQCIYCGKTTRELEALGVANLGRYWCPIAGNQNIGAGLPT